MIDLKTELEQILLTEFEKEIDKEPKLSDEQRKKVCELLKTNSISAEDIINALSI